MGEVIDITGNLARRRDQELAVQAYDDLVEAILDAASRAPIPLGGSGLVRCPGRPQGHYFVAEHQPDCLAAACDVCRVQTVIRFEDGA